MKRILSAVVLAFAANLASGQTFTVSGSKLLSPSGTEVRLRGINLAHWDEVPANIRLTHANAARFVMSFNQPGTTSWAHIKTVALDNGLIPIVGNWTGTCKTDPAILTSIVDSWVAQASTYKQLNSLGIVNIANEWGDGTSAWRDAYITAVQRLRAAGYTGTLMVDAGGCGQNASTIVQYGAAVLAADPLHNILFDTHVYASYHYPATQAWMQDYATAMAQLKASGLAVLLGEFGPVGVGPSPTAVPMSRIVSDAEANGFGWLAWAMDDNNLPNVRSDDSGFSMQYDTWDRQKLGAANFTIWGHAVVDQLAAHDVAPVYGSPTSFWCPPGPSCVHTLTVSSPIGSPITLTLEGNDPRITVNSTTRNFAWWSFPVTGTYTQTLVMTDAKGNVTRVPLTLVVSSTQP